MIISKFILLWPHRVVTHCRHKSGGIKTVGSLGCLFPKNWKRLQVLTSFRWAQDPKFWGRGEKGKKLSCSREPYLASSTTNHTERYSSSIVFAQQSLNITFVLWNLQKIRMKWNEMVYVQLKKTWWGRGEKHRGKGKMNKPHLVFLVPASMIWRDDCFPVSDLWPKTSRAVPKGGAKIDEDKKKGREGRGEERTTWITENEGSRSSKRRGENVTWGGSWWYFTKW